MQTSLLSGLPVTPATQAPTATPVLQPLTPAAPQQSLLKPVVSYRNLSDAAPIRQKIYSGVLDAISKYQPVVGKQYSMQLSDVDYVDPDEFSVADQKRAILTGGSLSRRLRGTWSLTDNKTGDVIDKRKITLGSVPHLTDDGTYIQNGTEYTLASQMRLRPGIYTRQKENGELEAHVNVMPGKGFSHRISFEPATGVFRIEFSQSKVPLITALKTLGVSDRQLQESFAGGIGEEKARALVANNLLADKAANLSRLYSKVGKPGAMDDSGKAESIREAITKMELDPETTKRTLGKSFTHVGSDAYLAAANKLLAISHGKAQPDDRDAMEYQRIMGPEDLFAERIDQARRGVSSMLRTMLWKSTAGKSLAKMQVGAFSPVLRAAIMESGLGSPTEGINPLMILDQRYRISRMGTGGIPSGDSVPAESRDVQASHYGYIDAVVTPESDKAGVDLRMSHKTMKGSDGRLYSPFKDVRTGADAMLTPQDIADAVVTFPGQLRKGEEYVRAFKNGKLEFVHRNEVQYELPAFENSFAPTTNMIPLKSAMKPQRAAMAQRMLTQALSIVNGEAPLVQNGVPGTDQSYEQHYARFLGAVNAERGGQVVEATPESVTIRHDDGTTSKTLLRVNQPFPRKTFYHQTPTVQSGQRVEAGDLLARSNYTDDKGVTALGLNARVAYIPDRGYNFEDAFSVSEGFAKRAVSQHMYQHTLDKADDVKPGLKHFISAFPTKYTAKVLKQMDDNGVIKPGSKVEEGDPLILAVGHKPVTLNQLHTRHKPSYADKSVTWDHHTPGIVTDVADTPNGILVAVKSDMPLRTGDKLSGRYGDKGVIARIIPDDKMPKDKDGRPYEVLMNPLGVISRSNPAQTVETVLGKIAEMTGKPYKVQDFDAIDDLVEYAEEEARKNNIKSFESVYDPELGEIPNVLTGNRFIMKLHHTAESKSQGRGTAAYTNDNTPAKGGETGSKRISLLDTGALLSHGATGFIRDAHVVRGQENTDYWRQVMSGYAPPPPRVPLVYDKFVNMLKASGINVVKNGRKSNVMGLTNKDVDELAGDRELQNAETVDWQDKLRPIPGGLFDPALTGSHSGNQWAKITLHEPMPSPVFEEPICRVLSITHNEFDKILAGEQEFQGQKGPQAIVSALKNMNVDKEIEKARAAIASGKKTQLDSAIKRLSYLKSAKRTGVLPQDWILDKVPVLPPLFRPVSVMGGKKMPLVADPNFLYKELFDANQALKSLSGKTADLAEERRTVYSAFKAVVGLGDPVQTKTQEKNVKGILKHVFGDSPKHGMVQFKLIGGTTDLVGRSTIIPDPDLDLDEVGIPEKQAWSVYKPFIIRRLVRQGMQPTQAARAVMAQDKNAEAALGEEIKERPVVINRAPVLHRFGIMAFWPRIVKDDTMHTNPLVVSGFGADFDGDAMQFHVPGSDAAVSDAIERMMPSKNLFAPGTFKVHQVPGKEYVGGLFAATAVTDKDKPVLTFQTTADAIRAMQKGEIAANRRVRVLDKK